MAGFSEFSIFLFFNQKLQISLILITLWLILMPFGAFQKIKKSKMAAV